MFEKNYQFNWEIDDTKIKEEDRANARGLKDSIKDVYCVDNQVVIEYTYDCKTRNMLNQIGIKKMKVPLKLKKLNIRCQKADDYYCEFQTCGIILAAYYVYSDRKNSIYYKVMEDVDVWNVEETNEEKVDIQTKKVDIESILVDIGEKNREENTQIINRVLDDIFLTDEAKIELLRLIKSLINYKEKKLELPLFNYTISENTDTINHICLGQEKCIDAIRDIMKYFGRMKEGSVKYVNFKELTSKDALTEENYKDEIIVLTNLHYLTNKNLTRGGEATVENAMMIKNNICSFILDSNRAKMFILCDRQVNIKEFFNNNQHMFFQFNKIHIKDLTKDEVLKLILHKLKGVKCSNEFEKELKEYIHINYIYSPYKNLEFIDFVTSKAIENMISNNQAFCSISQFPVFKEEIVDEFQELNKMIGLDGVKKEIKDLQAYLAFKKEKEKNGEKMPEIVLHMVFFGNPGTGKTTVARLMAGILFNLEYIRYNKCIECESKDLIANVPGETSIKTSEKIQEAMGGILFIDEAYAIGDSPYGSECIATLIKAMEDYRDDLIVILAGYRTEMLKFLDINSGFLSRIAYQMEFEDYTNDELIEMTTQLFDKYNVRSENYDVLTKIRQIYEYEKRKGQKTFGNSRFVRNTVDKILRTHAINAEQEPNEDRKHHIISIDDVKLD